MFSSFIDSFRAKVVDPAIDARMNRALKDGVAVSRAAAPVLTGKLQSEIGGHYDQATKTATIYGDASYTYFQEKKRHFLAAGLAAMGRTWGGKAEVQFTHLDPKYHARTIVFHKGKIGRAKLVLGHRGKRQP